ncbi:hypothetical protein PHMEG_0005670 [Phytophthora megakarya]|uniref:Uncharacterized protein n=1 Tax=Phytophthora megakarya TaxID=4795 RepID=A0A225WQI4_9STRA|nr:hypothetical protein PHMEG_0005670 [Phytophthora megakarya]
MLKLFDKRFSKVCNELHWQRSITLCLVLRNLTLMMDIAIPLYVPVLPIALMNSTIIGLQQLRQNEEMTLGSGNAAMVKDFLPWRGCPANGWAVLQPQLLQKELSRQKKHSHS